MKFWQIHEVVLSPLLSAVEVELGVLVSGREENRSI